MDSYSVQAILTLKDNMTAGMRNAANATESLGSRFKRAVGLGAAMQIGMAAVSKTMNVLSSNIGNAVARYDQLNNFPKVMTNLGISAKDSEKALSELNKGIKGLPTSLDAATSGVTRFTSKNGDIHKSTKYFLALNNAVIAGNQSAELQASAVEQLSQAYSKGKMDMMEWRSLQAAMPAQLNQIAKAMGTTTDALGEGLRNGTISMEEFMDAMVKLNEEGVDGFASFSEQAKSAIGGIGVAMTNLKTAVVRGMANCIGAIDEMLASNGFPTIGELANQAGEKIDLAFSKAASAIKQINLKGIIDGLTPAFNVLKSIVLAIAPAFKALAKWMNKNAEEISSLIPLIIAGAVAFKGYNKVTSWLSPLEKSSGTLSKTGKASEAAAKGTNVLKSSLASLAKMAGVALIIGSIALLAKAMTGIANAGDGAVKNMIVFGVVIGALVAVFAVLGKALTGAMVPMLIFAVTILAVGAALRLATPFIEAFTALIKQAGNTFVQVVSAITSAAMVLIPLIGETLCQVFTTAGNVICQVAEAIGNAFLQMCDGVAMVIDAFAGGFVAVLTAVSGVIDSIGNSAIKAGRGFKLVAEGIQLISGLSIGNIAKSLGAVATGLVAISSAGKNLPSVSSALQSLIASVKTVPAQFSASGKSAGMQFASGIQSGMSRAVSASKTAVVQIKGALSTAGSGAYTAGVNIGVGLANGMASMLGRVRRIAEQLAEQAEKAIKAKAKIGSPSKVTDKLGKWFGIGWVNGISDKFADAKRAASELVSIPNMSQPNFAMSTSYGTMDDSYLYGNSGTYVIEVPVNIDGKEVSRVTAPYLHNDLNRLESRENRKRGIR